jgi:UTP-glucose-1-phosphate uridylyltransferase
VFPAAGWGTRFLPATKAQPKEMLPLVDKPIIQYGVEEAVAAGIEQIIIVTSTHKGAIEDHFDLNLELEHVLEEKGEIEKLRQVRHISNLAQLAYVRQKEQLGLGHAILMAKDLIGHEPFAVLLPDDVVIADRPAIGQLIHAYERTHSSVVAVMQVPAEEVSRYGIVAAETDDSALDGGRLRKMKAIVEKPKQKDAPSARADAARLRWRDPAHRRDRGAHGRAGRLHVRVRGRPLRRRDHNGLAPGHGRGRAPASRPGVGPPQPPPVARAVGARRRGVRVTRGGAGLVVRYDAAS